jgi:hypothetical protein
MYERHNNDAIMTCNVMENTCGSCMRKEYVEALVHEIGTKGVVLQSAHTLRGCDDQHPPRREERGGWLTNWYVCWGYAIHNGLIPDSMKEGMVDRLPLIALALHVALGIVRRFRCDFLRVARHTLRIATCFASLDLGVLRHVPGLLRQ